MRHRFVSDDSGENYLIPAHKTQSFYDWCDYQVELWNPDLSQEDFERLSLLWRGDDFNEFRIDGTEVWTFENPKKDNNESK